MNLRVALIGCGLIGQKRLNLLPPGSVHQGNMAQAHWPYAYQDSSSKPIAGRGRRFTEADAKAGRISYASPLGRALIGRQVGEEVEFSAPSGDKYYEIKKIQFV